MRIVHIVTYLSADHAFGGPLSVARAQAGELARRGHDVALWTGWDGQGRMAVQGVDVRRFRAHHLLRPAGHSGLVAPGLLLALRRAGSFDVAHVHLARDLVTLPSARLLAWRGTPYVVQAHGMVMPDGRARARAADVVATRSVLRRCSTVLALTEVEVDGIAEVAGAPLPITRLPNGVPAGAPPSSRRPAGVPDVLFLARLHPRKRVLAFAAMAAELRARGVAARFSVVGPDGGDLGPLRAQLRRDGAAGHVGYEGALPAHEVAARLSRASVYVLPSVDEPFPMSVLEALAAGTPVVVTDTCHIADVLRRHDAALVTDGSPGRLADAVQTLLTDAAAGERLRSGGRRALAVEFSITAVGERLEEIYRLATLVRPAKP